MTKTVFRALALVVASVPGLVAAQDYQDTTPYVVDPSKYRYSVYPSSYQMDNNYSWESNAISFDPKKYYTPEQQTMVVEDEARILKSPVYFDFSDGLRDVDYHQATIPEATAQTAPAPTQTAPTTSDQKTFSKTFTRNEKVGNDLFGAGYNVNATITATVANVVVPKKLEAVAEGKVYGKVFNLEQELVRGRASITGQLDGSNSGSAALYALGQQIWSTGLSGFAAHSLVGKAPRNDFSTTPINWSRTFFSISKTFMIGPVPVTVKASLSGGVKLTVSGDVSPTIAKLALTPGGFASVTASAAVNIIIASFGVSSTLSLINATLPTLGELTWPSCVLNWKLQSDLNFTALSGNVEAFVKVKLLFFKKTWKITIAKWTGIV
ncbi:MAG: hypothetical protein ABW123_23610, partial [Cystobacter sp.]